MYAILDIETTGLNPAREKIMDEYSTLINQERKIPYRITQLTGINNRMVENSPRFFEVARKIVEFTEGVIIVGHNVRLDYGFIRQEFLRFGFYFQWETLDTVKLS